MYFLRANFGVYFNEGTILVAQKLCFSSYDSSAPNQNVIVCLANTAVYEKLRIEEMFIKMETGSFSLVIGPTFLKIVATLKCRNVVGKPPAVFSTNGFCQLTRCNISSTLSGIKTSRTVRQHCPSSLYRVAKVTRHFNKKCIFTKMYQNTIPGMYSHNFR